MNFPNPLFATPDFGAGASAAVAIVFIYLIIFGFCTLFFFIGLHLRKNPNKKDKDIGLGMISFFGALPFLCCLAPPVLFVLICGRFPGLPSSDKIKVGMTREEVQNITGKPHEIMNRLDRETWSFYGDFFGLTDFFIDFDDKGIVKSTYSH